jgi:Secretion system C-terminal sorting domain
MKKLLPCLLFIIATMISKAQVGTIGFGTMNNHNYKFFGLNGADVWRSPDGYGDPLIDGNLSFMKVKHVRYAEGTYSMFFNWLSGYPFKTAEMFGGNSTPPRYMDAYSNAANTISLFKNSIASEGAEMIYNLNLLTSKFNHQRAAIMYTAAIGQRIKAIELGNEFYNDGLDEHREFAYAFPTAEVYADSVNALSKTLHHTFGNLYTPTIIAIGSDRGLDNDNNVGEGDRIRNWLPKVLDRVTWAPGNPTGPDGITIHPYAGSLYDAVKTELDTDTAAMNRFLFAPLKNFATLNSYELPLIQAKGIKAYFTEYGLYDKAREVHGTWGHGLFLALQTLSYLESNIIELADVHSMLGKANFACIFSDSLGFDLPQSFNDSWAETDITTAEFSDTIEDHALNPIEYKTYPGQKTAIGNTLSLVGKALDDAHKKYKINFGNIPKISVQYPNTTAILFDKLYGWKLQNRSGRNSYIVMNMSKDSITVQLEAEMDGTYTTMAANPLEYMKGNAVTTTTIPAINLTDTSTNHVPYQMVGNTVGGANFVFKPYSITYIKGAATATVVFDVNGLCSLAPQAQGITPVIVKDVYYTIKVEGGVGPYNFTSNAPVSIAGNLNVTNSPLDYVTIKAYKPTLNSTPFPITFTVTDLGRGGISASKLYNILLNPSMDIYLGTTPSGTLAGDSINVCGCVDLTAKNIDSTPLDNRYEWYTIDGNGSINSAGTGTYGDNGYSQTVTICPKNARQKYYVIGYAGANCAFAAKEILLKTTIVQANPTINDEKYVYVCSTAPGNTAVLGNPPLPNSNYTYSWSVTTAGGTIVSGGNTAQPTVSSTNVGPTFFKETVTTAGCTLISSVGIIPYQCCTTAIPALKFPPYTKMSRVTHVIDSICPGCVNFQETAVTNFDQVINFNGPLVMDETDVSVTFKDCDNLQFAQYAKLAVRDFKTLVLDSSKADACGTKMWKGITAETAQEEIIVQRGSSVKNALYGIEGNKNALITAIGSNFDKNRYHMVFSNYGGNYAGEVKNGKTTKGIARNTFQNTGNQLEGSLLDRTTYGIWFRDCLGSVKIGGINSTEKNTFDKAKYPIYATGSGLSVNNNTFTNFEVGVYSINSKKDLLYKVSGNKMASNYFFDPLNTELDNKGTAIYITATSNITPDSITITKDTIDYCRQGVLVSKLNGKPLIVDLNSNFGGEIKQNIITLYQPVIGNQAQGDFTHKAIVLMDNTNIDVVENSMKTNNAVIGLLSTSQIDRYFGIETTNQGIGTDFFDNRFAALGKMILVKGNNDNLRLKCNDFTRGSRNYPGTTDSTGITAIELKGTTATLLTQGTSAASAKNTWSSNFTASYKRARRTTSGALINYYRFASDPLQDPLNTDLFFTIAASNDSCNSFQGMVINYENEHGSDSDDLAKDGENPIDSLATYQTVYDSTATIGDLYADANNFLLALEAVELGLIDSAEVMNNFENSAVYQVYTLETAMAASDSASIVIAAKNLPKDDLGDNYKIVANIVANTTEFTAQDSANLHYVAYQKFEEGGPAVINARNMLGIYLDETDLPSKSNKRSKTKSNGFYITISPNPNKGNFTLSTNMPPNADIKIYDSLGQLARQNRVTASITVLELGNLNNGLYHLTISDANGKLKSTSFVISK